MKIIRDLMHFEVHLEDGEDISKIISNISKYEKKYSVKQKTWYISNSNLPYFLYAVRDDEKLSL